MNQVRPNPDELLRQLNSEERRHARGHLRLFFGMSAGVGKTYAMLKAAHELKNDGINVQIGIVETHERKETKALVEGLPVIARKKIEYRGTLLEEMDLDEILRIKPAVVLVDELAHSNVPGSRHEKRYQDVIEILESGIDVYSTMNVQHLESRSDVIGLITATNIRETVPDSIMDWVDRIELIDLTPEALIERLKEGKVYPGRKIDQALQYFFQEKHLSVLREIVLRVTADKVDRDTRGAHVREQTTINHSLHEEKLLVAVSSSPHSDRLIRMARRLVEDLQIPWIAVHVDTGIVLGCIQNNQLIKNLELARNLGAEAVTLHGTDIVRVLSDYAKDHEVIQIVIGRPDKPKIWSFRSKNLVQKLIDNNPQADIIVLQKNVQHSRNQTIPTKIKFNDFSWQYVFQTMMSLGLTTGLSFSILPFVGYRAVGFLYLLAVVILSVFSPFYVVVISAGLSALLWNFLFIPPLGTFAISEPEDIMMCLAFFVISSVTGYLTAQIRKNQNILKTREATTRALYELLKSMTFVKGQKAIIDLAISEIENLFSAECCVFTAETAEQISTKPEFGHILLSESDRAVAVWAFSQGKMAGWSTDTLPSARVLCLCLKSGEQKFGVLVFRPKEDRKLNPEQNSLLISITNQISVALVKERYDEDSKEASLLKESERLHQTLLNCISHELRTPLTAIMGAATALQQPQQDSNAESAKILTAEIVDSSERLNQVFENLLDMSRLESGMIQPKYEWFDLKELLRFALDRQKRLLAKHHIRMICSDDSLYCYGDYDLLEHAFTNLMLNAAKYSPIGSEIQIAVQKLSEELKVEISDQGPGIPEGLVPHIFEKFYRIPGTVAGGLGLGLSIAKNLIEVHAGKIHVTNGSEGGSRFTVTLPYREPPAQIQEFMHE